MSLLGVRVVHTTPSGLLYLPKRIYLNLPTLDLALFTTNLLTDNMSHEDYAWWFLALNHFLGLRPKFINKYPKFSAAFDFVVDLTPSQLTFADGQVAELQKVLNDIITKNLVKFKFASCRQELASIKQQKEIATTGMWLGQSNSLPMTKLSCSCSSRTSTSWAVPSTSSSWIQLSCTST